jgi:hypothetical protein
VFASRKLPNAQELSPTTRDRVPAALARDVLVFDWWLHNEDRHLTDLGGNPNLLWDVAGAQLVVIDHNQAFDPDFDAQRFLSSHVFASHWNAVFGDYDLRASYRDRMKQVLQCLPAAHSSMPETWWWVGEDVPAQVSWNTITACLERCHRDDFWNMP